MSCRRTERFADSGPNPEQVAVSTELREMISENLDELSPLLRTAFVLRDVQGYSTGEAAKKLGVTENTLKARLWRARHQLAERLGRRLRRIKADVTGGDGRAASMMGGRGVQLLLSLTLHLINFNMKNAHAGSFFHARGIDLFRGGQRLVFKSTIVVRAGRCRPFLFFMQNKVALPACNSQSC